MLKIKNKLSLCSVIFALFALPFTNIFANENAQTSPDTNSTTNNTEENLKPSIPPPKEPKKDKVTPKIKNKFVPQKQQSSSEQQAVQTQQDDSQAVEQKPEEPSKKEQPKETKKQESAVPAEGDSGLLGEGEKTNEQESKKSDNLSEIDLPEVNESEVDTDPSFMQKLVTSGKKDLLKACVSCILVLSGLFIIIKVIIANFKIPKGYQPTTKRKHYYSKRKKYNYNIKR